MFSMIAVIIKMGCVAAWRRNLHSSCVCLNQESRRKIIGWSRTEGIGEDR